MGQTTPKPRNHAIDALRLLAAFGVIVLHTDFLQQAWGNSDFAIKLWFRWCVPFFFLAVGYFLPAGQGGQPAISWHRIGQICVIALLANLIYLPIAILFAPGRLTPLGIAFGGTWFHLWFLMSLIAGLVLLKLVTALLPHRTTLLGLAALLLLGTIAADLQSVLSDTPSALFYQLRFLQAAPLIYCGFALACIAPSPALARRSGIGLTALGIGLVAGQTLLHSHAFPEYDAQFPAGALPVAFGLLLLARSCPPGRFARLGTAGAALSLPIYIYHPIFLTVTEKVSQALGISPLWIAPLQITVGALMTYLFAAAIERYLPWLAKAMRGKIDRTRA